MLADYHTHTYYSDDSECPMKSISYAMVISRLLALINSIAARKRLRAGSQQVIQPSPLSYCSSPDGYSTISPEKRRRYFELFRETGVQTVFTGHLHDNAEVVSYYICKWLDSRR